MFPSYAEGDNDAAVKAFAAKTLLKLSRRYTERRTEASQAVHSHFIKFIRKDSFAGAGRIEPGRVQLLRLLRRALWSCIRVPC